LGSFCSFRRGRHEAGLGFVLYFRVECSNWNDHVHHVADILLPGCRVYGSLAEVKS